MNRREFIGSIGAAAVVPPAFAETGTKEKQEDAIAVWDRETELVAPKDYIAYRSDGNTRGFAALEKLDAAFEKVMREAEETVVTGDVPAVWSVYNMGYIVKTRESLFSIDLIHRRDVEFVPIHDFALVTHNHGDHWRDGFCRAMDTSHKTIISNFLENHGATEWEKIDGVHPNDWGMMSFARAYGNAVKTALGLTKQAKLER